MGINNFRRDFGLVVIAARPGTNSPPYKCDQEESGGSEPVPELEPRHGGYARFGAEIRANSLPEQVGRMLIEV